MTAEPRYPCHCRGCLTLPEPDGRSDEICPVCYWQDDYVSNRHPDKQHIGPNGVSLKEARANYRAVGVCEGSMLPHVRPPRPDELPPPESPGM